MLVSLMVLLTLIVLGATAALIAIGVIIVRARRRRG
jgi:hypothetical protein